jgi:hypothetical protein
MFAVKWIQIPQKSTKIREKFNKYYTMDSQMQIEDRDENLRELVVEYLDNDGIQSNPPLNLTICGRQSLCDNFGNGIKVSKILDPIITKLNVDENEQ